MSVYRYPAWFVDGRLAGAGVVGYGPRYATRALSESLAVADGVARHRAYRRLRLMGEYAYLAAGGDGLSPMGERVRVESLTDSLAVEAIAYAEAGTVALALVGVTGTRASSAADVALPPQAPAWIAQPPRDPDGMVVVGIARATYREAAGWQEAEAHGLGQLAAATRSRVRGLQRASEDGQESVVTGEVDAVLEGVVVLARWRDGANCFVLMRARGSAGRENRETR